MLATIASVTKRQASARHRQSTAELAECIGHDLNNLLNIISTGTMVQLRLSGDGPVAEISHRIQAAVWRASVLTHRLFTLSEPLLENVLELGGALEDVVTLAQMTAGDHVRIEIVSAHEAWTVRVNSCDFERALLNLVLNGAQAICGSGTVLVTARNRSLSRDHCSRLRLVGDDFVEIQITDSGRGMTADTMARAFEPHFTTKGSSGGSGLGLAQVQAFVVRAGGAIEGASRLGAGTTMSMYLPRAPRQERSERARGDSA